MKKTYKVIDGNEAAADSAFRTNELCIIYPITPATSMGELCDQWAAEGHKNIWDTIPDVVEMQSEAGACGAVHGALQTGALATTFTASQGLLLMIPDMFRIAAELTPTVFHVASRIVAYQGMSIFVDHSDVMATRTTGFAMMCSSNVQEVHDLALICQAAAIKGRVPFVHFFDGFRTSGEVNKIEYITDEQIKQLIDKDSVIAHRNRRMHAGCPTTRGTIYNSDIYFQMREAMNPYYDKLPEVIYNVMQQFTKLTGRKYNLVNYYGHPKAEKIIVLMGSGAETARETVEYLQKEKIGVLQIHLFQPFPKKYFLKALPKTCKTIAVLDRTKESGAGGEPLYQKVTTTILENFNSKIPPKVIGGRYGIAGKDFTPAMVKRIFAELDKEKPKNNFTIGINDDITHTHLDYDEDFYIERNDVYRAIFYGLGADGTVSANKNTMKIIGETTNHYVQGHFIYDAKKTGSKTISHLRFGSKKIRSSYLIKRANFIGCHQFDFVKKYNVLENATENTIFLLNAPFAAEKVWNELPCELQEIIIKKKIKFYVIDAYKVARETKMGARINTIMQTCFFALSSIIPIKDAINKIKETIKKTYLTKGEEIIAQNFLAVDQALKNLFEVKIPAHACSTKTFRPVISEQAPDIIRNIEGIMLADQGDALAVSCFPAEGYFQSCATCWEKRDLAAFIPKWIPENCIQCGRCSLVCPHTCIRAKKVSNDDIKKAPETFQTCKLRGKNDDDKAYALQIYAEDCTGCGLCIETCPTKEKALEKIIKPSDLTAEQQNVAFFESLPYESRENIKTSADAQFLRPFFEFSCACAGCGETPYVKLISQLFGNRMIIGDACGCSSVFGGSFPSPWAVDEKGHGPAWSSSLFEDNAEFAFGFALTEDKHRRYAQELLLKLSKDIGEKLTQEILNAKQTNEAEINLQFARIKELKNKLEKIKSPLSRELLSVADFLIKHSIWAIGGDGWAYDIGFGGLDHVIANNRDVNLLVLDTEVYSNTGGQASKSSARGSVAKFTYQGKQTAKKNLGLMAMTYGTAYVCSIAIGADPTQAIRAIKEAESYPGSSLILAYAHCIAHGIDMSQGINHQNLAVKCGYWPLYRYDPRRATEGLNPLQLDSQKPSAPFKEFAARENRYRILAKTNPAQVKELMRLAQEDIDRRWKELEELAQ
ncbi:MAG: pyruvate:ferredoxin (flavodoxin) oxidoreductase [Gammaproteobacteria bacterium]|jgi:pyruvate-ferredoxin/flavodoxin oxidoreductase